MGILLKLFILIVSFGVSLLVFFLRFSEGIAAKMEGIIGVSPEVTPGGILYKADERHLE